MEFKFLEDLTKLNYRSLFVNRVLKLIYEKHNGDLGSAVAEARVFFEQFDDIVRNVYELINSEIPLWAYSDLITQGADNFSLDEKEYNEAIIAAFEASHRYYRSEAF